MQGFCNRRHPDPWGEYCKKGSRKFDCEIPLGTIDITFYRDDLSQKGELPEIRETKIDFDISDKTILLVDDVVFSGRTVKAALDTLMDFGRPSAVRYMAFIDRGFRQLPFQPDYCGVEIMTNFDDSVKLLLKEVDDSEDSVYIYRKD